MHLKYYLGMISFIDSPWKAEGLHSLHCIRCLVPIGYDILSWDTM